MEFKIPKRFKVGSVDYDVRLVEHCGDNDDFGKWHPLGFIEIANQSGGYQVSESRRVQVFLHELTHAILGQMSKEELNADESFVNHSHRFWRKQLALWRNSYEKDLEMVKETYYLFTRRSRLCL